MSKGNEIIIKLWFYNPFNIIISSSGNADSLFLSPKLAFLLNFIEQNYCLSGLFYGIAVHLRLYPIIYGPAFIFHLFFINQQITNWKFYKIKISFALKFCIFSLFSFYFYSNDFLQNSFLYHFYSRVDFRHNFAPHFLENYLFLSNSISSIDYLHNFIRLCLTIAQFSCILYAAMDYYCPPHTHAYPYQSYPCCIF